MRLSTRNNIQSKISFDRLCETLRSGSVEINRDAQLAYTNYLTLPKGTHHSLYGSQSNGKGQMLTPWGSETPERISMKLGMAGMTTHANLCGAATTWANT